MKLYRALGLTRRRSIKLLMLSPLLASLLYVVYKSSSWVSAIDCSPSGLGNLNGEVLQEGEVAKWTEVDKSRDFRYCSVRWPDFVEYGNPYSPGEGGKPFQFDRADLTKDEWRQKEMDFKNHYFDEWVSRKVSVHRILPDIRTKDCLEQSYDDLPTASVVINFCNEEWSTLLRTVHSVLDRTPDHLLEEIILIDDASTLDYLHLPLEVYIQPIRKVRLIRTPKRLGLIAARNLGSMLAQGEVIVFLDSHIECFPGWIEPLLAPIKKDDTTVVFPIIPAIDKHHFGVHLTDQVPLGSLSLNTLQFTWMTADERPLTSTQMYVESPTMPGGLYAVSRSWFIKLGYYDPLLLGWGGENIEMSLKTWMCGGTLLTSRCSRVAHIFRDMSPVTWPNQQEVTRRNSYRVAEVWMDSYKHYFYERNAYNMSNLGDVKTRFEIRDSLQCNDFDWYMDEVLPELRKEIMECTQYSGQIKNLATGLCLHSAGNQPRLEPCDIVSTSQVWRSVRDGEMWCMNSRLGLRTVNDNNKQKHIVEIFTSKLPVKLPRSTWEYTQDQQLRNKETGLCMDADMHRKMVQLVACTELKSQRWSWQTREEFRALHRKRKLSINWNT